MTGGRVRVAVAAILTGMSVAALPVRAQEAKPALFPQGECSGVLCSTIGGSQAPQNQPRKSLFPEGECGGVLCSAIGGSQAPKHTEPPPACGGGLLCDMAPYAIGQPFVKPEDAERQRQAAAAAAAPAPEPVKPEPKRRKKTAAMVKRTPAPAQ